MAERSLQISCIEIVSLLIAESNTIITSLLESGLPIFVGDFTMIVYDLETNVPSVVPSLSLMTIPIVEPSTSSSTVPMVTPSTTPSLTPTALPTTSPSILATVTPSTPPTYTEVPPVALRLSAPSSVPMVSPFFTPALSTSALFVPGRLFFVVTVAYCIGVLLSF